MVHARVVKMKYVGKQIEMELEKRTHSYISFSYEIHLQIAVWPLIRQYVSSVRFAIVEP